MMWNSTTMIPAAHLVMKLDLDERTTGTEDVQDRDLLTVGGDHQAVKGEGQERYLNSMSISSCTTACVVVIVVSSSVWVL